MRFAILPAYFSQFLNKTKMTEKLFYEDSHLRTFTAAVLECGPVGERGPKASGRTADALKGEGDPQTSGRAEDIPEGKRYQIVLGRTAFFPEGGGQYADTGWLQETPENRIRVFDVQEHDGKIFHITDRPVPVGSTVSGQIDWEERFMKMQQHTGEHIVSGLVHARFGYDNVGFHLGSSDCTMDFNGEITREELHEIELRANEAVAADLDIQVSCPSREELAGLDYRSKIEIEGQVRIVTIPGFDVCACCAPHVKKTGEIGVIKLTNVQRYKGGVRVTMLCGSRALADYDRKSTSVRQISAALCAKEDEVAEAVEHLREECARLKTRLAEQQKEILRFKARESDGQEGAVCLFESGLEGDGPRLLMNLVMERGHELCAVFCGDDREGYRYVIGSSHIDLRNLVKELNAAFSGRGGGKPEMVQGSLKGNEPELRAWLRAYIQGHPDREI